MGFLGDILTYQIDWPFLLIITALAVIGILIGNVLSRKIASKNLRKAFGWLTLMMGIFILIKEIFI
jgi:uncharacterized protein